MNILYLIGNGFDINAGLETKAKDFVASLHAHLEEKKELGEKGTGRLTEGESAMLSSMRDDIESWGDFEIALGKLTGDLESTSDPAQACLDAYEAFFEHFTKMIKTEDKRAKNAAISEKAARTFRDNAMEPFKDAMSVVERDAVQKIQKREQWNIDFITFNYTCLLDRVVSVAARINSTSPLSTAVALNNPLHVHGRLSDNRGILIGVNDPSQLIGESCQQSERVQRRLVKPVSNKRMGMRREDGALSRIRKADIIAIYGMSLGESDSMWWREIAAWLCGANPEKKLLIISGRNDKLDPLKAWEIPDQQDFVVETLLDRAGVYDAKKRATVASRTIVPFNSTAFNLGIEIPEAKAEDESE